MKKVLLLILIFILSFLLGCKKEISSYVVPAGWNSIVSSTKNDSNGFIGLVVEKNKCYYFKEYNELTSFLKNNDLIFSNKEHEAMYSENYFISNILIIYPTMRSKADKHYDFNLYIEDDILFVEIVRTHVEIVFTAEEYIRGMTLYYMEVKKKDIENVSKYKTVYIDRWEEYDSKKTWR